MINFFKRTFLMPTHTTRLTCRVETAKLPNFVTNPSDLGFGGSVTNWNFPNLLVVDWIEILAFTRPTRPVHIPSLT